MWTIDKTCIWRCLWWCLWWCIWHVQISSECHLIGNKWIEEWDIHVVPPKEANFSFRTAIVCLIPANDWNTGLMNMTHTTNQKRTGIIVWSWRSLNNKFKKPYPIWIRLNNFTCQSTPVQQLLCSWQCGTHLALDCLVIREVSWEMAVLFV